MNNFKPDRAEYRKRWSGTDATLYALCRDRPRHQKQADINAKLWVIGRTMATGIERKIESNGDQGSSLSTLSKQFIKNGNHIDREIMRLKSCCLPLSADALSTILSVHGQIMKLISPCLRKGQAPRSFVSKYLHFHHPVVPVYDSIVTHEIRRKVRWSDDLKIVSIPSGADKVYAYYVFRFFRLFSEILQRYPTATVKEVDYHLLCERRRKTRAGRKSIVRKISNGRIS